MPTKAEITRLAQNSGKFIYDNTCQIVEEYVACLKGDNTLAWVIEDRARQLIEVADLLMEPLLSYAKEHIYHMPTTTYVLLHEIFNQILDNQEALAEIITRRNT